MRPVSLRFQCFGPYMEKQVIDFDRLAGNGLFLICGETGAGKTAILDAMCCALYCKSTGGLRDGLEPMRCKLAKRDDETFVDFVFEVGGERYRFVRSLRYARKNMNDSHNCMVWNGEQFMPLEANPTMTRVNAWAEELIGLSYEQFRQVIILPQGQFERLLVSKGDDMVPVLVSLFHAERWQQIVDELKRRADEQDRALRAEYAAIQAKLAEHACRSLDAMDLLLEDKRDRAGELDALCQKAAAAAAASRERYTKAIGEDREFRELRSRREKLDGFLRQVHGADVEETFLRQAGQAETIVPIYDKYREQSAALRRAEDEVLRMREAAGTARQLLETVKRQQDAHISRRSRQDEQLSLLARWQGALALYRSLDEKRAAVQSAALALREAEEADRQAGQAYIRWDGQWQQAMADRDAAVSAYQKAQEDSSLPQWREARPLYQSMQEKRQALHRAEVDLSFAESEFGAADRAFRRADNLWKNAMNMQGGAMRRYQEAQSAYFQGIGGILARELRPGLPCPVCGSLEHPAPAPADTVTVTDEQLKQYNQALTHWSQEVDQTAGQRERAERKQKAAKEMLDGRKAHQAAAQAAYDALLQRMIPGVETLEQLDGRIAAAQKALDSRKQAVADAEERIRSAAGERASADSRRSSARSCRDTCAQAHAAAQAALEEMRKSLIPGIDTEQQLQARLADLKRATEQYARTEEELREKHLQADGNVKIAETALEAANAARQAADAAMKETANAWQDALRQSGLASEAQFLSARMERGELERRRAALTTFRANLSQAQRDWEEQRDKVAGRDAPELDALRQQADSDEAEAKKASTELTLARSALERVEQDRQSLSARLDAHSAARQKADDALDFAACLAGRGGGVSLQRYVLGVMLTAVTIEANRLLENVHGGRYRLYRTDEGSGRVRKRGLELEVLDAQSGERRSVTTLSGGEKFLVALSLAIGLSTVVQAQGGGVRLEAMFIDEGFGSLDHNSIADAFDVLQGIQRSHGLVGIISHVEQLEETIQSKIEVRKGRKGSHITFA